MATLGLVALVVAAAGVAAGKGVVVVQPMPPRAGNSPGVVLTNHTGYNTTAFLAVVSNPADHFKVLYPSDPGVPNATRCAGYQRPSAVARREGCTIATNGGPFVIGLDPVDGATCLGNAVSGGRVLHRQSAAAGAEAYPAFAVTSDDTFVIGDVAASELAARKITQLVPGFGWLVRGGKVTVTADGGGLPVTLPAGQIAPRTLIGTDARGRLLLFVADGIEAGDVGLTLPQAAEWIRALGGHNVLNIDGGGSSTFVADGGIYDHPTCNDVKKECERPVTSVNCVF